MMEHWVNFTYQKYKNAVPEHLEKQGCTPFNLAIPSENEDNRPLCVVVVGHVVRHDLKAGKLLSHKLDRESIAKVFSHARKMAKATGKQTTSYRFAFINFNHHRNYQLKGDQRHESNQLAAKRVQSFIAEKDPAMVLVMGDSASQYLLDSATYAFHGIKQEIKAGKKTYPAVSTIEMATVVCGADEDLTSKVAFAKSNLFFYMIRSVATIFLGGKQLASVAKIKPVPYMVDTIKKFDRMMEELYDAPYVACDTETTSLEVLDVKVLTIQFATTIDRGYVVPIAHQDSPWDSKQLEYIRTRLYEFFTQELKPWKEWREQQYLITQFGQYDLRVIRQYFKIPCITLPVWDLIAGEHVLDENLTELRGTGAHVKKPYSLDTQGARYGNLWYFTSKFGKDDRVTIKDIPLNGDVCDYAAMDVQLPIGIHLCQQRIAQLMEHEGGTYHDAFIRLMRVHMTNMTHTVSTMKLRGMPIDLNYLLELCDKTRSPLLKQLDVMDKEMRNMPAVKEANKRVLGQKGAPVKGLFGAAMAWVFSITSPLHKKTLFIDVLGLEPLDQGANGAKLDKKFQTKYKDVPEVAALSARSKVSKLYDTYAKGIYKLVKNDRDVKTDHRVRPNFNYLLVTGRTSCEGPNLQQIPQHSDLAKIIKRLFIAPQGTLHIKYDFSAHEVRFWGIISKDSLLIKTFKTISDMIAEFRAKKKVTEEDRAKLELADVHKQNYSLFTGVPVEKVTKVQRQDSKAIGFGAIYGKAVKSMARDLNKSVEEMQKVYDNFFSKFKRAKKCLDDWCKQGLKSGYVAAPTGRRRNMWAGVLGYERCYGDVKRRSQNSPIQGIASDAAIMASRLLELALYEFLKRNKLMEKDLTMPPIGVCAMVHDSTEVETPYDMFFIALWIMEYMAITGVRKFFKDAFDYDLGVDFAIEMEVGATGDKMRKWDWTKANLKEIIQKGLEDQRDVLRHKLDVDDTMSLIYKAGRKWAPKLQKKYPLDLPPIDWEKAA
jgi:DNA polymerase I-like protein with 3'-5' exonuclease and polymerase domains